MWHADENVTADFEITIKNQSDQFSTFISKIFLSVISNSCRIFRKILFFLIGVTLMKNNEISNIFVF